MPAMNLVDREQCLHPSITLPDKEIICQLFQVNSFGMTAHNVEPIRNPIEHVFGVGIYTFWEFKLTLLFYSVFEFCSAPVLSKNAHLIC